jgi:N-acetylglucosaminyl-diphospho-decaprenol L-rhamnosyltransferase
MGVLRVSIIMNVRNGAANLREALDSVIAQTFTDWELILWDDCSTDHSAKIAAEYPDRRIRYFLSPEETSLGRARELAIRQARGEWLAFLDQDDIWLPNKLQQQMSLDQSDPTVGIIYGRTIMFSANGGERDFDHRHEFQPLPEGDIFERLFIDSCFIAMSSSVLRRSAVDKIGGIPPKFETSPDYHLFVAIAKLYRARAVQQIACRYRVHSGSMSHSNLRQMHQEALWVIDRWASALDPGLVARRRRIHQSIVALAEMQDIRTFGSGFARLFTAGSPGFLFSRPFARTFRAIRRRVRQPYWLQPQGQGHARIPTGEVTREAGSLPERATDRRTEISAITLSVIVVNWNVRDLLRDCLYSLREQMLLPSGTWEVIVVDNNSSDRSVEMIAQQYPEAVLLANKDNLGFAKANNQAFHVCRGKYVLLLNPDTIVQNHAIDSMVELMAARPDVAALGCRLLNADGSFNRWTGGNSPTLQNVTCHFLFAHKLLPHSILPRPLYLETDPTQDLEVGWVSGACMLLRREALGKTIFDERFFLYGEDMDLCDRLIRVGWKVLYTPHARIVHLEGRSLQGQSAEIQVSKVRAMREIFAKRRGRTALFAYDLVVTFGFLMRAALFGLAARLRPGHGYELRTTKSRQFSAEAMRALIRR